MPSTRPAPLPGAGPNPGPNPKEALASPALAVLDPDESAYVAWVGPTGAVSLTAFSLRDSPRNPVRPKWTNVVAHNVAYSVDPPAVALSPLTGDNATVFVGWVDARDTAAVKTFVMPCWVSWGGGAKHVQSLLSAPLQVGAAVAAGTGYGPPALAVGNGALYVATYGADVTVYSAPLSVTTGWGVTRLATVPANHGPPAITVVDTTLYLGLRGNNARISLYTADLGATPVTLVADTSLAADLPLTDNQPALSVCPEGLLVSVAEGGATSTEIVNIYWVVDDTTGQRVARRYLYRPPHWTGGVKQPKQVSWDVTPIRGGPAVGSGQLKGSPGDELGGAATVGRSWVAGLLSPDPTDRPSGGRPDIRLGSNPTNLLVDTFSLV
jgi:hypothetical protein